MGEFIKEHWVVLLLGVVALAEVVVRLTPTKKDDTILEKIKLLLDIFLPNKKKSGGTFKSQ